jgi:hypothetical protein
MTGKTYLVEDADKNTTSKIPLGILDAERFRA